MIVRAVEGPLVICNPHIALTIKMNFIRNLINCNRNARLLQEASDIIGGTVRFLDVAKIESSKCYCGRHVIGHGSVHDVGHDPNDTMVFAINEHTKYLRKFLQKLSKT